MRERLRLNFSFRFRKEVTPSRVFYFLIFYYQKSLNFFFLHPFLYRCSHAHNACEGTKKECVPLGAHVLHVALALFV